MTAGRLKVWNYVSGQWEYVAPGLAGATGPMGATGPVGATGAVGATGVGGGGDVSGPTSSVDGSLVLFNGTSGKAIKATNSGYIKIPGAMDGQSNFVVNLFVQPVRQTITSSSTISPNAGNYDTTIVTALATDATIASPGTPTSDTNRILIRIKDNGNARTLTWNAIYRGIGLNLPTTTVAGKTTYIGCVFNSADTKWDVIAVSTES